MLRIKNFQHELYVALEAISLASKAAKLIETSLKASDIEEKEDHSPVTVADFACQILISYHLNKHFPNDIIIGEEDSSYLQHNSKLSQRVLEIIRQVTPSDVTLTDIEWLSLLDSTCAPPSSSHDNETIVYERYWTIDPIDGTKGFLRHSQYATCLALLIQNQVQVGVLGCPNLPFPTMKNETMSNGTLVFAVKDEGAYQTTLDFPIEATPQRIHVASSSSSSSSLGSTLLESFESSHSDTTFSQILTNSMSMHSLRMDSQCKYTVLARGEGHVFLRMLPDPKNYVEKIWDHTAGTLIAAEAGGIVTDILGNPLRFHPTKHLSQNLGILATCGPLNFHQSIIEKLNATMEFQTYIRKFSK